MQIDDTWEIEDRVSGLRLKVVAGEWQNALRIEQIGEPICGDREFFFNKDGSFDGTGSGLVEEPHVGSSTERQGR